MPIVGYSISEEDNDTVAFGDREGLERCPGCLHIIDKWNAPLNGVRIRRRQFDLSCTYDGVTVASSRFRDFVQEHKIRGIEFRRLPDDRAFHQVVVTKQVQFDAERRETRFEDQCPICRRFDSVAGATPAYLLPGEIVDPMEVVRTDVEFGSGDEQNPVLVCGLGAARLFRESDLTEFYLKEVVA
jgi:hypothetical protein